jgi:tRNA1(Val) A37 N6-methylase TrmN6
MGSGTALFECEKLQRKYIGIDINPKMINYVSEQMQGSNANFKIKECNALDVKNVDKVVDEKVQFVLMHPPYMDIVKFTDKKEDLSSCDNIHGFIKQFKIVCENSLKHLEKNRYFAIVIGDVYKNSEGNRGKLGAGGIWRLLVLNYNYRITLC